jgi:hypothetical protein
MAPVKTPTVQGRNVMKAQAVATPDTTNVGIEYAPWGTTANAINWSTANVPATYTNAAVALANAR